MAPTTTTTPSTTEPLRLVAGPVVANLRVRPARPSDRSALEAMFGRSSDDTLYRRFHGPMGSLAKREIHRISQPTAEHRSWVAVAAGGVRGTATLVLDRDGTAELAFVVEDDWQRHGVGRALAVAVLEEAARLRVPTVVAFVQAENWRARQFFRSVAPEADARLEDREVVVRIPVAAALSPVTLSPVADGSMGAAQLARHA